MVRVIAEGEGYNRLEFIFKDWVEAAGFMSIASRNTVNEELHFICDEVLPEREFDKRPPEGFVTIDDDITEALKE